jgi:hypothetical protein
MIIFIGNLPAAAPVRDICVSAHVPGGAIARSLTKPESTGALYRYALVHSRCECEGHRLIARLDGRSCHNHRPVAGEFRNRPVGNERWRLDWRELSWNGAERRVAERGTIRPYRR